jgi:hypothetical protein
MMRIPAEAVEAQERIQAELRGQLGRTKADFRLWQDKTAIAHGELWEDEIKSAVQVNMPRYIGLLLTL